MNQVSKFISDLVHKVSDLHPRDQSVALAEIRRALDVIEENHLKACEMKQWRHPLAIAGVLKNVMRYLPVPDLLNCRLVSHEWWKAATDILNVKASTKPVQPEMEDIGFGWQTALELIDTFEGVDKLPFDQLRIDCSVRIAPISLEDGVLVLSLEDIDVPPEEKIDPMIRDLGSVFGERIYHLEFMLEEPLFVSKVLDYILQQFPALRSLSLPFMVYPLGEVVSPEVLSSLKSLSIASDAVGPLELMWSMLSSAPGLERINFMASECFDSSNLAPVTMLHHFLCIPPPPERKNMLNHLTSLHISGDFPDEMKLFSRLAKMKLQLTEFKFISKKGVFSSQNVQLFLESVAGKLRRLNVRMEEIGDGPLVPLAIGEFVANFRCKSLEWICHYETLQSLEVDASGLQDLEEDVIHRRLRSLKLKNFPPARAKELEVVAKIFPSLMSLEVPGSYAIMKTVFRAFRNLEELMFVKEESAFSCLSFTESLQEALSGIPERIWMEYHEDPEAWSCKYESEIGKFRERESWIGNLTQLRRLVLNGFHGLSYCAIKYGISECLNLQDFSAAKTDITDEGLMALSHNLTLVHVNVKDCPAVTTESLRHFREMQPFCFLEHI